MRVLPEGPTYLWACTLNGLANKIKRRACTSQRGMSRKCQASCPISTVPELSIIYDHTNLRKSMLSHSIASKFFF